jgi:hypothetical protein
MATETEERLKMELYGPRKGSGYRAQCTLCPWKTQWLLDPGERDAVAEYHASTHAALTAETASHTLSG